MQLLINNTLSAFAPTTVGSKVTDPDAFTEEAIKLIASHTFPTAEDEAANLALPESKREQVSEGQAGIPAPSVVPFLSSGDAPRTGPVPDSISLRFTQEVARGEYGTAEEIRTAAAEVKAKADGLPVEAAAPYIVREHRGETHRFLARSPELPPAEFCVLIVYTMAAYLRDKDVQADPAEVERAMFAQANGTTHALVAILASCGPRPTRSPYRFVCNLAGGNRDSQVAGAESLIGEAGKILDYTSAWVTVAD